MGLLGRNLKGERTQSTTLIIIRYKYMMKRTILVAVAATSCVHAFVACPASSSRTHVSLNMGLFDGVKEAFGADGMGDLSSERETPIDRWMGWNAKSVDTPQEAVGSKGMFNLSLL